LCYNVYFISFHLMFVVVVVVVVVDVDDVFDDVNVVKEAVT
jgi:hypothetical protein